MARRRTMAETLVEVVRTRTGAQHGVPEGEIEILIRTKLPQNTRRWIRIPKSHYAEDFPDGKKGSKCYS